MEAIHTEKYIIAPNCAVCGGLEAAVNKALQDSGKSISLEVVILPIHGDTQ